METDTQIQTVKVEQMVEASTIERLYIETRTITDDALAMKVIDYPSSDNANLLAKRVNVGRKRIDTVRKTILAEPKRFTTAVNAMFKPIAAMCDSALIHLDRERSLFAQAERAKLAAEEAKAKAEEERRQTISIAKGGSGENIKPVEQPVDTLKIRSTDVKQRIPDRQAIQSAIDEATKKIEVKCPLEILGVSIYAVWKFDIIDSAGVPDEFRKDSFVDA